MFFAFDPYSFALGLIAASAFWWLVAKARPVLGEIRDSIKERNEAAQTRRASGIEENHRRVMLRRAQGMHLAAPLFSLDEILQEPRLMAPLPMVVPGTPPPSEDVVTETLPYMPTWPELAAIYKAPTLSVAEVLAGGRNIVITGNPGMGKTVALAHLASQAANRSEQLGDLQNHVPFLVHVADLKLPVKDAREVLNPIIGLSDALAGVLDLGRLPDFIEQTFRHGRALLLVDGFDELPVEGQQIVSDYLGALLQAHPKTRIVVTGSFESLDGLIEMGFAPLALSGWSSEETEAFTARWGELWAQFVSVEAWTQMGPEQVDPILLNEWLAAGSQGLTPLELTMRVWAAYAGDSLGPHVLDAVSTHIRRLAPANTPPVALDTLALQVVLNSQPFFDPHRASNWVSKFDAPGEGPGESDSEMAGSAGSRGANDKKEQRSTSFPTPSFGLLSRMINSGLLLWHTNGRMRFAHPVFEGYLAGRAMNDYSVSESILNQPDWIGKTMALRYLAAHGDMTRLAEKMIEWSRLPMHRPLLGAARWLRDAPQDAPWRGKVMTALVQLLQTEGLPLGLRGQAMAAFVLSNDPGAPALFRQFMNTLSFELVQLCTLGSGALRDTKAVKILESILSAPSLAARRAACLALVAIGTNDSLEIVARALLNGDEELRRAAAESLANDRTEGHTMLKDGTTLQDILLRRAVVYGLARVEEPWALGLLEKLRVEDQQWVVRNSASEVLDQRAHLDGRVPRSIPIPSEAPWLIEFAGKQGVGIRPGSPGTELLLGALKSEDSATQLASLPYLKQRPSEGVITQLYHAMYAEESEVRESIYLLLMEIAASGVKLPHPSQFGIG